MRWILVAACGALGVLARYGVQFALAGRPAAFPAATLAINVLGCLLAGLASQLTPLEFRPAIIAGFLGGFTTFSAYSLETTALLGEGRAGAAVAYFLLSPALGLAAALAGLAVGRWLSPA